MTHQAERPQEIGQTKSITKPNLVEEALKALEQGGPGKQAGPGKLPNEINFGDGHPFAGFQEKQRGKGGGGEDDAADRTAGPPQSYFNRPYNQSEVKDLIKVIDTSLMAKDRDEAVEKLQRMGPKVIPDLQQAIKDHPRRLDLKQRMEATINFVTTEHNNGQYAIYKSMPGWKELLVRSNSAMVNNESILKPFVGEDGKVQEFEARLDRGSNISEPTKLEQEKIDALMKKLDGIDTKSPEFQKKIQESKEKAQAPGASYEQKIEYLKLYWLQRAKSEAKELYCDALSMCQDPATRAKGGKMFMETYMKDKRPINFRVPFAEMAIKFGLDKDPKFIEAFKARGGTDADIDKATRNLEEKKLGLRP